MSESAADGRPSPAALDLLLRWPAKVVEEIVLALLPELSAVVNGMDDRFRHVESMMGDLGDGVLGVLGSIPGVRRSLRPH